MAASRSLGVGLPDEGEVRVTFDDSIITDTSAEKRQDMAEVASGLMNAWEYRAKWYGEDETTARRLAGGTDADNVRGCASSALGTGVSGAARGA